MHLSSLVDKTLINALPFDTYYRIQQLFGFPILHSRFKKRMGFTLNLENAETFNQRISHSMVFNRDPRLPIVTDKLRVRDFVAEKLGKEVLIPVFDVVQTPEKLDFDTYPESFVLKTNFMSGGNIFVPHRLTLDRAAAVQKLSFWMNRKYGYSKLNWPAQHIPRRILVEHMLLTSDGKIPADYKVYCTNGEPQIIQVDLHRHTNHRQFFFTLNWELLPIGKRLDTLVHDALDVEKPKRLGDLTRFARILAEGFPFMRVDFYSLENDLFFGEMTPYPGSGSQAFEPYAFEVKYGALVPLIVNK